MNHVSHIYEYLQWAQERLRGGISNNPFHVTEVNLLEPNLSFESSMEGPPHVLTIEDFPELLEPASPLRERQRYENLRQKAYAESFRPTGSFRLDFRLQRRLR